MIKPEEITIAITCYDRQEFILEAVASALNQTVPVKVILVENHGPSLALRDLVLSRFGGSVVYHRNDRNRGMFDNWNACVEYCQTPWLSILHDDDLLDPGFVAAMIELENAAPGRCLYFGGWHYVDEHGARFDQKTEAGAFAWEPMAMDRAMLQNPVAFPGQLFRGQAARAVGGFRAKARYCGDWEMWFRLGASCGAAKTNQMVASVRDYRSPLRGTSAVNRTGVKTICENVQRKRNARILKTRFDRREIMRLHPLSTKYLLANAATFTERNLRYHLRLLKVSAPTGIAYRAFQFACALGGAPFLKLASRGFRRLKGVS